MKKYQYIFLLVTLFLFTGCNQEDVKVLKKDFLKTKIGTVEKQKFITKIVVKKPVKKKKVKKVNVSVKQKKQRFQDILVPIVTEVYNILQRQFEDVRRDISQNKNLQYIEKLKEEYKADSNEKLLQALKPHPISITLAQGAIESAWLTSRFTTSANNIFGVWSFRKNEPRIEATGTRGTKKIYLKKYKTFKAAVYDYYKNIAKNWAYVEFREKRVQTNNPYELTPYLGSYSEKKEAYIHTLNRMIEYNKFDRFDIK